MNRLTSRRWLRWLGAGLLVALIMFPVVVLARAGGGGGFSSGGGFSGGGFSGGGSGGGDGGGAIIELIIWLIFLHPQIGIPLAIVAAVFFVYSSRQGRSAYVSHVIRGGYTAQDQRLRDSGIAKIKQRDPGFDVESFLERVEAGFPQVQAAWSDQDMTPVRPLVSDGIYERFQLQLEMQKQAYLRNVMQDVQIVKSNIAGVESDDFFDTLHVRVTASAVDYTEDTRNGKLVEGSRTPEPFTEIWSYLRRPGAKTLEKPGLVEGFCPNCGTALELSDSTRCPSCRALINSGEYDWVLTEITQVDVWKTPASSGIPGIDALLKKDPAFNVQHVEDRASVIFWRLMAAEFFASERYLKKLALAEFLSANAAEFRPLPNGKHKFMADAAIGSADITEIELCDADDGFDRVHVHIRWSGHEEECRVPSLMKPEYDKSHYRSQDFVLVRKSTVRTSTENTLSSVHCPGCGAPQTIDTNGACEYCGLLQNDGSTDWVLQEIKPFFGVSAAASDAGTPQVGSVPLISTRLTKDESEQLLRCAIAVMLADGVIDPKEQKALKKMAERRDIPESRLAELVSDVQSSGSVDVPELMENAKNHELLVALVRMCLADGNVSSSEREVIKSLVEHGGYSDVDVDLMINQERARLYAESKALLKSIRRSGGVKL